MVEDRWKIPLTLITAPADIAVAWRGLSGGTESGSSEQTRQLQMNSGGLIRAAVCAAQAHRQG